MRRHFLIHTQCWVVLCLSLMASAYSGCENPDSDTPTEPRNSITPDDPPPPPPPPTKGELEKLLDTLDEDAEVKARAGELYSRHKSRIISPKDIEGSIQKLQKKLRDILIAEVGNDNKKLDILPANGSTNCEMTASLLDAAVSYGYPLSIIQALIEKGSKVELATMSTLTQNKDLEVVKYLLSKAEDTVIKERDKECSEKGVITDFIDKSLLDDEKAKVAVTQLLMDKGANIDTALLNELLALDKRFSVPVVKCLLGKEGHKITSDDRRWVHRQLLVQLVTRAEKVATDEDVVEITKGLLEYDCDPTPTLSLIANAIFRGRKFPPKAIKLLVEHEKANTNEIQAATHYCGYNRSNVRFICVLACNQDIPGDDRVAIIKAAFTKPNGTKEDPKAAVGIQGGSYLHSLVIGIQYCLDNVVNPKPYTEDDHKVFAELLRHGIDVLGIEKGKGIDYYDGSMDNPVYKDVGSNSTVLGALFAMLVRPANTDNEKKWITESIVTFIKNGIKNPANAKGFLNLSKKFLSSYRYVGNRYGELYVQLEDMEYDVRDDRYESRIKDPYRSSIIDAFTSIGVVGIFDKEIVKSGRRPYNF